MAEEEPAKPVEDPQLKELQAEEEKARMAMVDASFAWSDVKRRLGYYQGYIAGREATKESFTNFLKQMAAEAEAEKAAERAQQARPYVPPPGGAGPTLLTGLVNSAPKQIVPAKDVVLNTVKVFPGLRGNELLREIHKTGLRLHERTLRTILFRHKVTKGEAPKHGQLVNFERRWYVYPDVPEEAKPALQRIIDMVADTVDKLTQAAAKGSPPNPKDDGGQQ